MEEDGYIENEVKRWKNTFVGSDRAYEGAVRRNYRNAFAQMNEKFRLLGRPIPKEYVAMNLYRETRCRNHFGKDVLENMFGNYYKYTPLMDQQLHRLKLEDGHCKDRNLLMALIFTRYTPELLKFKFDSGRKINTATIAYAEKLNRKFPYLPEKPEENIVEFMCKPAIIIPPEGNSRTTMSDTIAEVKRIFTSRHICGEFLMEYDTSIYKMIQQDVLTRSYQPLQGAHTAIAISKSIFDCALSQNLKSTSAGESLCRDVVSIEEEAEPLRKNALLDKYFTIRLDIRNDKSIKRYVFERLMSFVNYLRKALEKKK
jgi:hypothetical protein